MSKQQVGTQQTRSWCRSTLVTKDMNTVTIIQLNFKNLQTKFKLNWLVLTQLQLCFEENYLLQTTYQLGFPHISMHDHEHESYHEIQLLARKPCCMSQITTSFQHLDNYQLRNSSSPKSEFIRTLFLNSKSSYLACYVFYLIRRIYR